MSDVLDQALASMADVGPDLRNGMSNHAPMAIEALCTMGREDAVGRSLDRYRALLAPRPPRARPIAAGEWRTALGDRTRMTDWFALFEDELAARSWRDVVDTWVARLAPAFCASAMHGVIRTGHAVRALTIA